MRATDAAANRLQRESVRFMRFIYTFGFIAGAAQHFIVEGDAGAGMVKMRVNGKMEVTACVLSDEAVKLNDKEMLEDLVAAAINDAVRKVERATQDKMQGAMAGMQLPPGMKLPF